MCVVSNIADTWTGDWWRRDVVRPYITPEPVGTDKLPDWATLFAGAVTRAEFEALKKELGELRELIKAAAKFDKATGQPGCEKPDKLALILALAKALGVEMPVSL